MPMKRRDASADFTRDEWRMVERLHLRYQQDHDLLSARDVERLRFLRWLAVTGRLVEDGGPRRLESVSRRLPARLLDE